MVKSGWKDKIAQTIFAGADLLNRNHCLSFAVVEVARANFKKDVLKTGSILIPTEVIYHVVAEQLEDAPGVRLNSLECRADGIRCQMDIAKKGLRTQAAATFKLVDAEISTQRQQVTFAVLDEHLTGKNWLGKVAASLLLVMVQDLVKTAISMQDMEAVLQFDEATRMIAVDFSSVEAIKKLRRPLPGLKTSILEMVCIRAAHDPNGLRLKINKQAPWSKGIEQDNLGKEGAPGIGLSRM